MTERAELSTQYAAYKESHKERGNKDPDSRAVRSLHSLLHFYGRHLSYRALCDYSAIADSCKTEAEADLIARAIITAILY